MILRRTLLSGSAAALVACATSARPAPEDSSDIAALEARVGGRLGVAILETQSGRMIGWRMAERFGLCSTFKLPLAGAILAEVDAGRLTLDQAVRFGPEDMVPVAPVTGPRLKDGVISVGELAEGTQKTSDNVAANLLLKRLGGPEGFTAILRGWGDSETRVDRFEPGMNLVPAGEVRDTTTPRAMAATAAGLLAGSILSPVSRETLTRWTVETQTGLKRLRAGLPPEWRAGDKTGTGIHESMANKINDVAIAFPPGRAPVTIAAYYETPGFFDEIRDQDQAVLAEVGAIAARWIARGA